MNLSTKYFCVCVVLALQPGVKLSHWTATLAWSQEFESHMQHWGPITMTSDGASEGISYRHCAQISATLYYMVSKLKILWWWNNTSFPIFCYFQVCNYIVWGHNNMVSYTPLWCVRFVKFKKKFTERTSRHLNIWQCGWDSSHLTPATKMVHV